MYKYLMSWFMAALVLLYPAAAQESIIEEIDSTAIPAAETEVPSATARPTRSGDGGVRAGNCIKVTSLPEGASVTINDVTLGKTPYENTGFLPGLYEVKVSLDDHDSITKVIRLIDNTTESIHCALKYRYARLRVTSSPQGAQVYLNGHETGTTPWTDDRMQPGIHRIKVELEGFGSALQTVALSSGITDSVRIALVSRTVLDSLASIRSDRFRTVRRYGFGALTIGFGAAGIYYNQKAGRRVEREAAARDSYDALGSTSSAGQFDAAWELYQASVKETDTYLRKRNAMYILSGIAALGCAISIPF